MYIYSYNQKSEGAKELAKELKILRVSHNVSKFKGDKNKTVINWGSSELPKEVMKCKILNHPDAIFISTNKLTYLLVCYNAGVRVPEFTENIELAKDWIKAEHPVMCRRILNGSGGDGIVYAESLDTLVNAPLYTKYIPKKDEYRIHFANNKIFYLQRKYRNPEENFPNWIVRNLEGGFLYENGNVEPPLDVLNQAHRAFAASTLDFGAVDVIWNDKRQKAYVLEINTAPGLEGRTLQEYKNIFIEMNK